MKNNKTLKDKTTSQKSLAECESDLDSDQSFEDFEEDQIKNQATEEDKISVNGESQIDEKEIKKNQKNLKSKVISTKNPTKKLRNQKKPRIVLNISDTKYEVVRYVGKKLFHWKLSYDTNEEWDLFWTDNSVEPEQLAKMQLFQKINHFPGMYSLARKNHLGRNLMRMRKNFPDHYKFFPPTWLLPAEYSDFKAQFNKKLSKTFIIKPEASCQGRGIFLTRSFEDVDPCDHYVAQRYIHKPYLIDGLKFDCRIYVLLAGTDPLRIYLYNDGLGRFATEPYVVPNKENLDDVCMHLTNYAINKDNPNFVFNENADKDDVGHKRSFISVLQSLKDQGADINKLKTEIKEMIIKTFCSVQPILSHNYKSCQPDSFYNNMCFEVLGFDILIDHKLKPWLLEVNHTPSFTTDTPFDRKVKKNVIKDSLILMNISVENRIKYKNLKKIELQKRVLTGIKLKLTPEEKIKLIELAHNERDEYENKNLGGFEKLYPLGQPDEKIYEDFIKYSTKLWEEWTGANIRRNTKKLTNDEKMIKEKGTPSSVISTKKSLPINNNDKPFLPMSKPKTSLQNKQSSQTVIKMNNNNNTENPTQIQSLPNISQKTMEINENLQENSKIILQNTAILANKMIQDLKNIDENEENKTNEPSIDDKKINGFRIKTKIFNLKQSPIINADDEIIPMSKVDSNATTETHLKDSTPSENPKKLLYLTKNSGHILKNAENKPFKPFDPRLLEPKNIESKLSDPKIFKKPPISKPNYFGNYVTPKVMEFAFNGLLRPEEERLDIYRNSAKGYVGGTKQKGNNYGIVDFGLFGNNANMFNVQKHINYFQNPKH